MRVKKIVNNASKQAESEEVTKLKNVIKRLQAGQPLVETDLLAINNDTNDSNNEEADISSNSLAGGAIGEA